MDIGIIGYGYVGKAVALLGELDGIKLNVYDLLNSEFNSITQESKALDSDYVFVCVPTDFNEEKGDLDTTALDNVVAQWAKFKRNNVLVIKSTIPVGTVDNYCEKYDAQNILFNPEFLTQRKNLSDFMNPFDVVIGGRDDLSKNLGKIYEDFFKIKGTHPYIVYCSAIEAELVKIVRNSFYASKVSFFNQIEEVCKYKDINYESFVEALNGSGRHPWVGNQHLSVPGPDGKYGFGGKCLPKDSKSLIKFGDKCGVDLSILKEIVRYNEKRRKED